jgi:hypothetical protein
MTRQFALIIGIMTTMLASTGCTPDVAPLQLTMTDLRSALGVWPSPSVVNLVVYTPRTESSPPVMPRQSDPDWNPSLEERRITAWNGEDVQRFTMYFWRGSIDRVRVRAVIATGPCGTERTVIADGENPRAGWTNGGEVQVALRPALRVIETEPTSEGCP